MASRQAGSEGKWFENRTRASPTSTSLLTGRYSNQASPTTQLSIFVARGLPQGGSASQFIGSSLGYMIVILY